MFCPAPNRAFCTATAGWRAPRSRSPGSSRSKRRAVSRSSPRRSSRSSGPTHRGRPATSRSGRRTFRVAIGTYVFEETLGHLVNDLLMGCSSSSSAWRSSVRSSSVSCRDPRAAALPAMAALGGMFVPALVFLAFNAGGEGSRDGASRWRPTSPSRSASWRCSAGACQRRSRCSSSTLAIVDDIGAIVVIAIFYSDDIEPRLPRPRRRASSRSSRCSIGSRSRIRRSCSSPVSCCGWSSTSPASTPRSPAW